MIIPERAFRVHGLSLTIFRTIVQNIKCWLFDFNRSRLNSDQTNPAPQKAGSNVEDEQCGQAPDQRGIELVARQP